MYPKGLVHGFGLNLTIILSFSFRQYKPGKCVLSYSRTKKTPVLAKETRSLESRNIEIFAEGLVDCFGPKLAIVPFFLGNITQKNVIYHILERKNAFLG